MFLGAAALSLSGRTQLGAPAASFPRGPAAAWPALLELASVTPIWIGLERRKSAAGATIQRGRHLRLLADLG